MTNLSVSTVISQSVVIKMSRSMFLVNSSVASGKTFPCS